MRRFLAALALALSIPASASTYTVDDNGDDPDINPGDDICSTALIGGVCTLRAAIMESNANADIDAIEFDITGVITPLTEYPAIVDTVTIEGRSAPGYAGSPLVLIDGSSSSLAIGLHFDTGSSQSELLALEISGFSETAVLVDSDELSIRLNWLGPITQGVGNFDGLRLNGNGSTVGGADNGGNVISGNDQYGIVVTGTNHVISDNFIGTDETGTTDLPNFEDGIIIDGGASGVRIGSDSEGEENVISGNFDVGVTILDGTGNTIAGNFIGTDESGTAAIPNFIGIEVLDSGNTIGTTTAPNLISGNDDDGIDILANDTVVQNNLIGPDVTGAVGLGNFGFGVFADTVTNIDVGGSGAGEGNVISFNGGEGIFFLEVEDSRITGNIVGLDAVGTNILGNGLEGILLIDSFDITVAENTISGNSFGGIVDAGGIENIIEDNRVGTTSDGNSAAGNLGTGIELFGSLDSIVRSNVVSANGGHGIETTFGSTGAIIHSNIIGLGADLTTEMGNFADGVNVCDGASDTVVGSVALGGNIITGSGASGIGVEPSALTNNTWAANSIYENELLGIDIDQDDVTPNDEDDPDEGANNLQNYPELEQAVTGASESWVSGTINTLPDTAFTLHFYSSPDPDTSGFGEGKTYLGELSGTTDSNGDASFIFNGPVLAVGDVVTATATTVDGSSEFSEAQNVVTAPTISFSLASYSAGEADGIATITVTRSGNLDVVSTVDFATSDDTALAGSDYTATSGTLTFALGDDTETFDVAITNDSSDEPAEVIDLTLSNQTSADLAAPSAAELTITDDDDPPTITIEDVSLDEGNSGTTNFVFTISLSTPSGFDVTVDYDTADGGATAGSDYTAQSDTATILAGSGSTTITIPVSGDLLFEDDETFVVDLSNATNASISDDQATGTIENDDATPTISIGNASETEGTDLVFTISLSGPSEDDVTVTYTTADDTADDASDYTAQSDVATITAGTTSTTVTVPSTADALFENDETFFVNLSGSDNITDGQGLGTIENDDAMPTLTIDDVGETEGTDIVFTVTLSAAAGVDVAFDFDTANDTATGGADYTTQSNSGTITAGTTTTTITVPTTADALFEPDETFFVDLSNPSNATIADDQGTGTIENDDPMPTITIDDEAIAEGEDLVFTVTLSAAAGVDVTVDYETADGTADSSDYTPQSDVATIPAGSTTATITVPTTEDALLEPDETLLVSLSDATNATIADDEATGTIQNDEGVPTLTVEDASAVEGNDVVFTLTLSEAAGVDVTVDFETADGTATDVDDYTPQSGTATITAGNLTTTINVPTAAGAGFEGDETFFLDLSNPGNAALGDDQAIGTIEDGNAAPSVTISDESEAEGDDLVFTLTLSTTSDEDVTVDYETEDGTATAGDDYTEQSDTAVIPAGSMTATITVPTDADGMFEDDETLFLNLTGAGGATISDDQGQGTIENGDPQPSITIDDDSETEGTDLVFTVTLSAVAGVDVTVDYETSDGTATAGSDYTAQSDTAVIPAGSLTATITVPTTADGTVEPDETLSVDLSNAGNASIADDQGTGTIENDDTIAPNADLSISKTTPVTTFTPGQQVTYTITVENGGPLAATGITVTDELPAGTSLVSATSPDAVCIGTTTVTCTIAALANGGTATITLVVVATGNQPISNTATVSAAAPADAAPGNNSAFAVIAPAAVVVGEGIPTLSEWALLLLAMMLAGVAMRRSLT